MRWSSQSGAELWLQLDRRGNLIGVHPHFAGTSAVDVRVEGIVHRDDQTALDGALDAWVNGQSTGGGDYPFVVDCANYHQFADQAPPSWARVHVAAFAHELDVFRSIEHFDESQKDSEVRFASQSFVPAGSFNDAGPPEAEAFFCGHVVATETRVNDLSRRAFQWMQVDTYAATFDVVADPELIREMPSAGSVIKGTFWLSARIESSVSRAGWLKRMMWRIRNVA